MPRSSPEAGKLGAAEVGRGKGIATNNHLSRDNRSSSGETSTLAAAGGSSPGRLNGGGATTTTDGGTKATHESEGTALRSGGGHHHGAPAAPTTTCNNDNGVTGSSALGQQQSNGDGSGSDGVKPSPRAQPGVDGSGLHHPPFGGVHGQSGAAGGSVQQQHRHQHTTPTRLASTSGAAGGPLSSAASEQATQTMQQSRAGCQQQQQQQPSSLVTGGGSTKGNSERPKLPRPEGHVSCPRCSSHETKFCYYNNYNPKQPRYFCKGCQRYWTAGGTLRNVPVGSGRRKNKSAPKKAGASDSAATSHVEMSTGTATVDGGQGASGLAGVRPLGAAMLPPEMLSGYFPPAMLLDHSLAYATATGGKAPGPVDMAALAGAQYLPAAAINPAIAAAGVNPLAMAGLPGLSALQGPTGVQATATASGLGFAPVSALGGAPSGGDTTGAGTSSFFTLGGALHPPAVALAAANTSGTVELTTAGNSGSAEGGQQTSTGDAGPEVEHESEGRLLAEDGSVGGRRVRAKTEGTAGEDAAAQQHKLRSSPAASPKPAATAGASHEQQMQLQGFVPVTAASDSIAAAAAQQQQLAAGKLGGAMPMGSTQSAGATGGQAQMEWMSYMAAQQAAQLHAAQLQALSWNGMAQNPYMAAGMGWPYGLYNGAQNWAAYARIPAAGAWMDPSAAAAMAAAAQQQGQQQAGKATPMSPGAVQQQQQAAMAAQQQQQAAAAVMAQQQAAALAAQQQQAAAAAHAMQAQAAAANDDGGASAMAAALNPASPNAAGAGAQAAAWSNAWVNLQAPGGLPWGGWGALPGPHGMSGMQAAAGAAAAGSVGAAAAAGGMQFPGAGSVAGAAGQGPVLAQSAGGISRTSAATRTQ